MGLEHKTLVEPKPKNGIAGIKGIKGIEGIKGTVKDEAKNLEYSKILSRLLSKSQRRSLPQRNKCKEKNKEPSINQQIDRMINR